MYSLPEEVDRIIPDSRPDSNLIAAYDQEAGTLWLIARAGERYRAFIVDAPAGEASVIFDLLRMKQRVSYWTIRLQPFAPLDRAIFLMLHQFFNRPAQDSHAAPER